jgi:signal transduction histidine kinase
MAVLLPIGWYLGDRMVRPLIQLANCLGRVGRQPLEQIQCTLHEGSDEIGQLGVRFHQMLHELEQKQRLETQMVAAERLAAVGRLAAGVAHEINNPLGGMLNAISTYRRHGSADPVAEKTFGLLERGLQQIRDTVSALLVEARASSHDLTPQDVDDVATLLRPDAQKRAVRLSLENSLAAPLPVPASPVRQVLINLSLNAVQATPAGGAVHCRIHSGEGRLAIEVDNEGETIPAERLRHLFEPFVHHNPAGHGLGLWVTYQIIQQLQGRIDVESQAGCTRFTVLLPVGQDLAA